PQNSPVGAVLAPPSVAYDWSVGERCSAGTCPGVPPSSETLGRFAAPTGTKKRAVEIAIVARLPPMLRVTVAVPGPAISLPPAYPPSIAASARRCAFTVLESAVYHQSRSASPR